MHEARHPRFLLRSQLRQTPEPDSPIVNTYPGFGTPGMLGMRRRTTPSAADGKAARLGAAAKPDRRCGSFQSLRCGGSRPPSLMSFADFLSRSKSRFYDRAGYRRRRRACTPENGRQSLARLPHLGACRGVSYIAAARHHYLRLLRAALRGPAAVALLGNCSLAGSGAFGLRRGDSLGVDLGPAERAVGGGERSTPSGTTLARIILPQAVLLAIP